MNIVFQFDVIQSFMQILGYERIYGESFSDNPDIHRDPFFTVRNAQKVLTFIDAESTKYRKEIIETARIECLKNNVEIDDKFDDVSIITDPMMIHFICVGTVHMIEKSKYYEELRYNVFNTPQHDQLEKKIKKSLDQFDIFCREQGFSVLLMKIQEDKANHQKENKHFVDPTKEQLARQHVAAVFRVREKFGIYLQEKCHEIHYIDYISPSLDPPALNYVNMNTILFHEFMEDPFDFHLIEILSVLKFISQFMIEYKQEIREQIIRSRDLCLAK